MELTVICGTCGDESWIQLAQERALRSAMVNDLPAIHAHGDNVAHGRNLALAQVETEWVVCCDADDELELGFARGAVHSEADVRAPKVRCCRGGRPIPGGLFQPRCAPHFRSQYECNADCLPHGNWLVVGSVARTDLLRSVGGWDPQWPIYEDWALWLTCYREGASFDTIPRSIYRQHLNPASRNHAGSAYAAREQWHRRIVKNVIGSAEFVR